MGDRLQPNLSDCYGNQHWFKQSQLKATEPERVLYLAIPVDAYRTFFQLEFTQTAVQKYQVLLVVYDPLNELIVQWIK